MKKMMKKLNPDKFDFESYDPSYGILEIGWWNDSNSFDNDSNYFGRSLNAFVKAIKEKALGYCEASSLRIRPRKEGYAVLCENSVGELGWFHIDEEMFQKVCEA